MQVHQLNKTQFIVTVTHSEELIINGYSTVFGVTIQDAALIMCIHGWNSYAKKMCEYNRNVHLATTNSAAQSLLDNDALLNAKSNEAKLYHSAVAELRKTLAATENRKADLRDSAEPVQAKNSSARTLLENDQILSMRSYDGLAYTEHMKNLARQTSEAKDGDPNPIPGTG